MEELSQGGRSRVATTGSASTRSRAAWSGTVSAPRTGIAARMRASASSTESMGSPVYRPRPGRATDGQAGRPSALDAGGETQARDEHEEGEREQGAEAGGHEEPDDDRAEAGVPDGRRREDQHDALGEDGEQAQAADPDQHPVALRGAPGQAGQ